MKAGNRSGVTSFPEWPLNADLIERVQALEARQSIAELFGHYARCVDLKDSVGVAGSFAEDGEFCGPQGTLMRGRERIGTVYHRLLAELETSSHLVGNVQVQITSEDRAIAHVAFQAWDSYLPDAMGNRKPDYFSYGQYAAEVVRGDDGEWRFSRFGVYFNGQLEGWLAPTGRSSEQFGLPWPLFSR